MFLYVHKNSKTHDDQRNKFFQIEFLCIFSGDRIFSGVENRIKIANEFNNYFISVATKLNESNEDGLPT